MKHGGVEWIKGKPNNINDFSVNLNPLGTPDFINELIYDAIKNRVYEYYPDNYRSLKENIAEIYNVDIDYIGVFNGATEVLRLLDPKVVPEPNFLEYRRKWIYFAEESENKFVYSLQGDDLIISNPNNPTGSKISLKDIRNFLDEDKKLVIDESFADISDVDSAISLVKDYDDNLLIISTFTKSLSIPGLRIGFSIGKESSLIESKAIPWRINSIAYYVIANVNPKEVRFFFKKSQEYVRRLRSEMISTLSKLPIKIYESYAPYILAKFNISVNEINSKLKTFKIRDCSNYIGLNSFYGRISVKEDFPDLIDEMRLII
ncbi:aminotransferase class I/II-fold pyridoxal phosphate-dependent enzyme [Acidianus sulfidivorans JP7]|uniref:histidinol-phosphate transaminase n=1 Tax=Acidianus sulfidivorans JP7 TaxID=619593 RepID=A0A2U9IN47_9CREN|nr:aminotransferase class I/II-fold pyridoxal phosphate-dependent enzyme [Acidianus sulfidivorans]AWR97453.1 aminotransferase class I/II-fold pyridoxal phosphate-dependent enzyme [Acidianus sulfidivorans JP7]